MLIGFCGPEGAGKSYAAKVLAEATGFPIVPFARPLKKMIEALGVDLRHLYGTPKDKAEPLAIFGGQPARHAMQTLGTEWGRQCIGADFWVRAWLATVAAEGLVSSAGDVCAIADDVRFPNEARAILDAGGVVIQVVRSELDLERQPRHASEDFKSVPFTFRAVNSGTSKDLLAQIDRGVLFRKLVA